MHFPGFRPVAFRWLKDLEANNTKAWFEANRATYDEEIRAPLALLVEDIDARLGEVMPEMTGTPKRNIFRIHRDVRFSKDKNPYKTNAACWWGHRDAARRQEEAHPGASLYFQIGAREHFAAGGTWMPPRPTLLAIREAIVDDPKAFARLVSTPPFVKAWGRLDEDGGMLQRLPRGYAPGHAAEAWLRYQSFTVTANLKSAELRTPALVDLLTEKFTVLIPFTRWLNGVQGLRAATRR